jgi:uncharacterized protein YecE (DUF72 family)
VQENGLPELRIGTSGWIYRPWRGAFYPAGVPQSRWLDHYASQFDTAEINATFYRLPTQAAAARWREATPPGFLFSWKASRFVTHMKRLREPAEPLARVYAPMAALGDKLGPALFQLPPQMTLDLPRLADFLAALPSGRQVLEFRHPSWYADEVFGLLSAHGVALCISDHHHAPAPWVATAPFVYVRGHGPGGRYAGSYPDEVLADWAAQIARWHDEDRDVFAYFDNDIGCAAPGDAMRLKTLLSREFVTTRL